MTNVPVALPTLRRFIRGYTFKAGSYIYVNSPMISRSEWHPFSIIQVPGEVSRATFYAEAVRGEAAPIVGVVFAEVAMSRHYKACRGT